MVNRKEKDTTVWKPKGNQQITRPSGPAPRRGRKAKSSEHRAPQSQGYEAPSSGWGKFGLLVGVGALLAYFANAVKNSDYYNDKD